MASESILQVQDIHITALMKELQGALLDHDCARMSAVTAVLTGALVKCTLRKLAKVIKSPGQF